MVCKSSCCGDHWSSGDCQGSDLLNWFEYWVALFLFQFTVFPWFCWNCWFFGLEVAIWAVAGIKLWCSSREVISFASLLINFSWISMIEGEVSLPSIWSAIDFYSSWRPLIMYSILSSWARVLPRRASWSMQEVKPRMYSSMILSPTMCCLRWKCNCWMWPWLGVS